MSPPFIFRIDEIRESADPHAPVNVSARADWVPPNEPSGHRRVSGGVSGRWWLCNGSHIEPFAGSIQGIRLYKTYTMYYLNGFGFWVSKGDATQSSSDTNWQPLRFDHDRNDGYSSYLCNASTEGALLCRRNDQHWIKMLLPDIYHGCSTTGSAKYGALKGELPMLLGLIAFAMQPDQLPHVLPNMFTNDSWNTFAMPHGRINHRGVVVYVYTCPKTQNNGRGSTKEELAAYEQGHFGKYYN